MGRTPPKAVRTELAQEVGFGCPVVDCGSPYLTWHHFDPPWEERQHHEPRGMIALCQPHHSAADAGTFTLEDLREMKAQGRDRAQALRGRFEWRRRRLLAVAGGNFYYETTIPVQLRERPIIWFNRDEEDRLLLNVDMPSAVREPRLHIDDNFWMEVGEPHTVECPPSGRIVSVAYPNGDAIRVEFFEILDGDALLRRYRHGANARRSLDSEAGGFPVTAVEVRMRVLAPDGSPLLDFDANELRAGGLAMIGSFFARDHIGLQLG